MTRAGAKWAKWSGLFLLAIAGLAILAVGGGLIALNTRWGSDRLRGPVLHAIGESIRGKLEYRELRLRGTRVVLEGLVLRDPEGEVVAKVESLELQPSFLPLLRREVRLSELLVRAPQLWLKQDARGLNLSRAIASRAPQPPEPKSAGGKPPPLTFSLGHLALERGAVELLAER